MHKDPLIPEHGGYRTLKSFQIARLLYDVTVRFCDRFIEKRSRTHDQMVQAARSGVQNIAEGSQASGTSKKIELKLTNIARASLEELRLDYEDYLRQRQLPLWPPTDPRRKSLIQRKCSTADEVEHWVLQEHKRPSFGQNSSSLSIASIVSMPPTLPELAANAALTLTVVACSLLDRQIDTLAQRFETEGGFTEKLYRIRSAHRDSNR
jgi:four helix bundle suffix protein